MRKLVAVLALVLATTACTPKQIRAVLARRHEVLKQEQEAGPDFMSLASSIHNDPFLACTRAHESDTAGGYTAYNSGGPYFGAYQFLQGTWDNVVRRMGWLSFVGVDIRNVSGFVQDVVAAYLFRWQGKSPWGGRC